MNLDGNPIAEQLHTLLRECDDSAGDHLLWVARNGDVRISRLPSASTPSSFEKEQPEMQMRYEPFHAGNEYVGPEAASDNEWVTELFESLRSEWVHAKGKPGIRAVLLRSLLCLSS